MDRRAIILLAKRSYFVNVKVNSRFFILVSHFKRLELLHFSYCVTAASRA